MPTKKSRTQVAVDVPVAESTSPTNLADRVAKLETELRNARETLNGFVDDLAMVRSMLPQMDARTLRGERVMLSMQVEQIKMSKLLDLMAKKLKVSLPAPEPDSSKVRSS